MIFAGDVAIAHGDRFDFSGFNDQLLAMPWCLNLEGAIVASSTMLPLWGVYNTGDWWSSFKTFRLAPVFIGNNHLHDIADGVRLTIAELTQRGLTAFGAGINAEQAARSALVRSGNQMYSLLGYGWPVIGCHPADESHQGINRLEGKAVLRRAEKAVLDAGPGRVVVVIHGNYEFECYPQPGHRQLAMMLIDRGVYAVICHHPHIVGPVERYKGRTIAYSLGNWAFSYGRFFGGRLRFPESIFHQIALELGSEIDTVHHVLFSPPSTVSYQYSECVDNAEFSLKPTFEGFSPTDYEQWFRRNRLKRKLLPVYRSSNASMANWFRDRWVAGRQVLIDAAVKSGLKAMRRRN